MSHGLDFTKGRAAMAFRGSKLPWHGFGQSMPEGEDWTLEEWQRQAGADFEVVPVPSQYEWNGEVRTVPNRVQLVRSDTGASLSEMSGNKYKIHQPAELFAFFKSLTDEKGDFQMRTAGVLHDGKKLWAMAERKDGAQEIGSGLIKPYLLLCGSFDGTMATTGRFTSVEVVCQNTLAFSAAIDGDTEARQRHVSDFDVEKMQIDLGAFDEGFAQYCEKLRAMAKLKMTDDMAGRFFTKLYSPEAFKDEKKWQRSGMSFDDVSTNKQNVIADLIGFYQDNLGVELEGNKQTLFGALRTVTFYHDHEARSHGNKRWESATIGNGNRKKNEALELALSVIAS